MKWLIPYAGEIYEFDDSRISASEGRLQKRITDGLTPVAAENKRFELDPDAWLAALAIARRRRGLDADQALDVDLDELDLPSILDRTREAAEGAAAEKKATRKRRPKSDEPESAIS